MRLPSKFVSFDKSVLRLMMYLVKDKGEEVSVAKLFEETKNKFKSPSDFIDALEILYLLDVVNINFESGKIMYAD